MRPLPFRSASVAGMGSSTTVATLEYGYGVAAVDIRLAAHRAKFESMAVTDAYFMSRIQETAFRDPSADHFHF